MYEHRDGRIHFILIDFNMATVLPTGEGGSYILTSKHWTGTLPFMAVDLINDASKSGKKGYRPIAHRLCHNFKSIFWLCLWCIMIMFPDGLDEEQHNENVALLRAWETSELKAITYTKEGIHSKYLEDANFTIPPAVVEAGLRPWFKQWTNRQPRHSNGFSLGFGEITDFPQGEP